MEISGLSIGEVARRSGLRASAVRFYEKEHLLPRPARSGGRRVYEESILERLAVIEFAKQSGFRLEEIRRLLQASEPVSSRWQRLVRDKLEELNLQQERIAAMRVCWSARRSAAVSTCRSAAAVCFRRVSARVRRLT